MLVAPQITSADILLGISDWTTITDADNIVAPTITAGYFSLSGPPTPGSGSAPGGSMDGTWGNDATLTPAPTTNNGTSVNSFQLHMSTTADVSLGLLLFDAVGYSSGYQLNISYEIQPDEPPADGTAGPYTINPIAVAGNPFQAPNDPAPGSSTGPYTGYSVDLNQLFLAANSTVIFTFTYSYLGTGSPSAAYTDNLAITAVPETGSMLGLGCIVGAGAFFRSRRRRG